MLSAPQISQGRRILIYWRNSRPCPQLGQRRPRPRLTPTHIDLSSDNTPPTHPLRRECYWVRLFPSNCERSGPTRAPTAGLSTIGAYRDPAPTTSSGDHPQQRNGPLGVPGRKPVATHITVCIAGSRLHITPPATSDNSACVSSRWSCCRAASCVPRFRNMGCSPLKGVNAGMIPLQLV